MCFYILCSIPHSPELLAESGFCSHGQKYQQHQNNHDESMCVVEIFGSDSCFRWMTTKGGSGMFQGVIFHKESNGGVSLAVRHQFL
jgi:hypothetical protein